MAWYYLEKNTQNGPYEEEAFLGLIQNGTVQSDAYVFGPGISDWQSLAQVQAAGLLASPQPDPSQGLHLAPSSPQATVACPNCGAQVEPSNLIPLEGGQVCPNCRDVAIQRLREGVGLTRVTPNQDYAGFWKRCAGSIIDGFILYIYGLILQMVFMGSMVFTGSVDEDFTPASMGVLVVYLFFSYAGPLVYILYPMGHVKYQGTLGMILLKIKIIRPDGTRAGRWRLFLRYLASTISGIILGIGYLMMLWDPENRTLHDMMCDTRVVNK